LYLTVNYHTQQFQLAQAVPVNGLITDLVSFDSSASVGCPVNHSVSGGDIGAIVVGSTLAIILIAILFLWFYKWRRSWNEMKTMTGLKADVRNLTVRIQRVEDLLNSRPHEVEGRPVVGQAGRGQAGRRHAVEEHAVAEHVVEGPELAAHGVEQVGRHSSFGSSEMAADTSHQESIVQNPAGRMETVDEVARPQPVIKQWPATNPFRSGTVPRERHGSNVSSEPPDRSPLEGITERQLARRNMAST
jgi:hypothetical protein